MNATFKEGQIVREKSTGRIGIVNKCCAPPWDVYISVRFVNGTTGYRLACNFEQTNKIPKFRF